MPVEPSDSNDYEMTGTEVRKDSSFWQTRTGQ